MNVLFITADQWRGDSLSARAHPCVQTPHLDALAADGVLFLQHYSQASPCGPGRASLYTGMYLQNHRCVVNGTPLDARHTNVALEARKGGYDPVLFGYTDTSADPRLHAPGDPALKTYSGVLPGMTSAIGSAEHETTWLADLKSKGYETPADFLEMFRQRDEFPAARERGITYAPARYSVEDSYPAFLTDQAIKHLSMEADGHWFLHLSYLAPHPPWVAPEPYHDMYDPADVPALVRAPTPEDEASQHPYLEHLLYNQRGWGISYGHDSKRNLELSDVDVLQARATYYGMMSEVDAQIGRLTEFLKTTGVYDETIIVFTSDHGEQLGDHWQFAKYAYFDQSFHIPLIIRDPRREFDAGRGRQVKSFTENVDVMPTILECLGLSVPRQCDGESLLPFARGETPTPWRTEAHWELDFRDFMEDGRDTFLGLTPDQCTLCVMRSERFKYVHFTAMPAVFFDLQEDPEELHNLADDPAYQALMLEHAQKMLSWRMNHDERVLANTLLTSQGVVERKPPRYI